MLHERFVIVNEYSIQHPVSNNVFSLLFTLFGTIHLFINIRNNWTTEHLKKLLFCDSITHEGVKAEFRHLITIYKREKYSIIKQTKLSYSTVFPSSFGKQIVELMLNIFNEKTVAALQIDGYEETATLYIVLQGYFIC